jgi:hypothetical protein
MRIYLAGCEQISDIPSARVIKNNMIENGLLSFYYMLSDKDTKRMSFLRKHIKSIIIDSGAHTFFSSNPDIGLIASGANRINSSGVSLAPDDFFSAYLEWLKINYDNFDFFVELDIGEIVGQDKVRRWREALKKVGLFDKCICVYHPSVMSRSNFEELVKKNRYIAVEGLRGDAKPLPYLELTRFCYEQKTYIHGFAMVRDKYLRTVPFTSVDSITWKSGAMYGRLVFRGSSGEYLNGNINNTEFRNKSWLTSSKFANATKGERRYISFVQSVGYYSKKQEFYSKLWKSRGINWEKI